MKEEKKPNNPEAFAYGYGTDNYSDIQKGMTLRDYFAAKAMSKLDIQLMPKTFYDSVKLFLRKFGVQNTVTCQRNFDLKRDTEFCYLLADAMLKQREL